MVMIFGTISPAFAAGFDGSNEPVQKTESESITKDGKHRIKLVLPKDTKPKRSINFFKSKSKAPAKEPPFDQTTVKVKIIKHGVGSEPFNFDAVFGAGASKSITLYDDADGADPDEQEVTFSAADDLVEFTTPIPMGHVTDGDVSIEFEGSHVTGRLTYVESAADYSGESNITTFKLDLYQIRNTDVVVTTKNADGTVVANPTTGKIKLGSLGKEIAIPAQGATGEFADVDSISVAKVAELNADPGYSVEGLENGVIVDKANNKVYKPGEFVVDSKGIDATTLEFTEKPIWTDDANYANDPDYVAVTFAQGDHGTIAENKTYYVFKGVEMASALTPPTVTANTGWTQKTGPEAWNPALATKYDEGKTHVAQYQYIGDDVVPQNPGEDKPNVPDNFVKVDFSAGDHGTIAADQTTIYWVNPEKEVTVTAPTVTANAGYTQKTGADAWDHALTATFAEETTITAQYESTAFDKNNVTGMVVKTQPKLVYVEGSATEGKLDLTNLVVTLTDKNGNAQDVPFNKLGEYGITANPTNGTDMTVAGNNGKPVVLTKDNLTANTDNLKVTQQQPSVFDKEKITGIEFTKDPSKMIYTEGDKPEHAGLEITLTDENGNTKVVTKDKLGEFGITVTPAEDAELAKADNGKNFVAKVNDKDGKEITANSPGTITVNEKPAQEQSEKPTINQPTVGDDKITGTGKPGATIVVKDGNGDEIGTTTVKPDGTWEVTVTPAETLVSGETITATQTENGKSPSEPATETVKDKTTPTPQGPSVTYPDTDMDKGDTKTVTPDIKDKDGKTTIPDTTPEVVQPGNGVVVTPHPDGSITVTIPEDYDGPSTIVIPVVVSVDGEVIKTTLTIHVNDGGSGYEPGGDDWYYFPRRPRREIVPTISVFAEPEKKVTPVHDTLWYVFYINEYEYEVVRNGVVTKRLMDVTPVLQNDRTMLPLRYVAEALGAEVEWDNSTRTARFTKDGLTASIQIDGDEIVLSNGKIIKMDSKPLNINDRILVSVTNVANVFGMTNGHTLDGTDQDIEWNQDDKSATIYVRR